MKEQLRRDVITLSLYTLIILHLLTPNYASCIVLTELEKRDAAETTKC